jgi:guanylate kinase
MRGLILTGPTGVGKSTAQSALREKHGFWVPRTCTTRLIEANELDLVPYSRNEFLEAVRARNVVLPTSFGGQWYGWLATDLDALRHDPGRAVLNVRPYPALLLQGLLENFCAVWLTLDEGELARRRTSRFADRDTNAELRQRRHTQDQSDLTYRECFAHVCVAGEALVVNLLGLVP